MRLPFLNKKKKPDVLGAIPFDGFFTEDFFKKTVATDSMMKANRPSVREAERSLKMYLETKSDMYHDSVVKTLLRFRVIMSDYRFEKLLKRLRVSKKSAIHAMAESLLFSVPEGEAKYGKS